MTDTLHAVVCAGALAPAKLRAYGIERIPLLTIGGETILDRTCRSLVEGCHPSKIHVLAPSEVPITALGPIERAQYSGHLVSDLLSLVKQCPSEYVLVVCGDVPLISAEAVREVCQEGVRSDVDFLYPIASQTAIEHKFPDCKRTYAPPLLNERYSGGNLFWVRRQWLLDHAELHERIFQRRKQPLWLAQLFGWKIVLRVIFGRATLSEVEQRVGTVVKGKMKSLVTSHPEIAVDLDKPSDYETLQRYLDPIPNSENKQSATIHHRGTFSK